MPLSPMEETPFPAFLDYARLGAGAGIVLEQFRRKETVHAYLISGALGLGKATFAKALTSALFCVSEQKPCGHCPGCRGVFGGANPDVITLASEGNKQIGVEAVRAVIETISQHAFGTGTRVVLIEPVERLTAQAQNCLLKSLEEPVSNVVFLLMAHELTALLGTIASRCVRVKLTPWPDDVMKPVLFSQGYDPPEVERVLPLAGGNIGQAVQMLEGKEKNQEVNALVHKILSVSSDADVVSISTGMKDDRESAERYVSALEQSIHQALLVRTGQMPHVALSAYPKALQIAAESAPLESLTGLLKALFEVRRLRASQVNWQSSIDHLMIRILEERKKWRQS